MRRHNEQLQLARSAGGWGRTRRTVPQWQLPSIIQHLLHPLRYQLAGFASPAFIEQKTADARLEIDLERVRAAVARSLDETGGGVDRARRADRDEKVAALQHFVDAIHAVRHLAEPDDVRTDLSFRVADRT